jgi:uncharacterized protein YutE (UPF0331/DUF86 family)
LVDGERTCERLRLLEQHLDLLDDLRARGLDAYRNDIHLRLEAERALQVAIQICVDLAAHLVAEQGLTKPDDYRGLFTALAQADAIDSSLAERLAAAAGLRNLLVHAYAELDDEKVWEALGQLDDLRAFAAAVERALK